MPLYVYTKKEPPVVEQHLPRPKFKIHPLPIVTSFAGLLLIASVVWPVLSYELTASSYQPLTTQSGLLLPVIEGNSQLVSGLAQAPKVVGSTDFTKATNWFPTASTITPAKNTEAPYTISIPKLRIEAADVRSDIDDLSVALIHYPGTGEPGQLGSPVIFGHSILPQFYNPKNYMSIFSLLPTLNNGDEIKVEADGITYTYIVTDKIEVYPTDLSPLAQQYEKKQIKLITCVPPGLKTKRLVVTAELAQL